MKRTRLCGAIVLGAVALSLARPPAAVAACWECYPDAWQAWTFYRAIKNPTNFECGWDTCGDKSHSKGNTWVDFVGGISSECNDHSSSFYGPRSGEWHGCSEHDTQTQESFGWQPIQDVAPPTWDRWPLRWRYGMYQTDDISFLLAPDTMRDPFGTVYDLDLCSSIDPVGTVYWGNFPVYAELISGSTTPEAGFAVFHLSGQAGASCGPDEGQCRSSVCSDLMVSGHLRCYVVGETCGSPDPPPLP